MDEQLKAKLKEWAGIYNVRSFISDDPVQFPHRFTEKRDIEISAFLTAWISYGRRAHILQKAEELHRLMGESPYEFIRTGETSFAPLRNRPFRMSQPANAIRFIAFIRIRTSVPSVIG